MNMDLARQLISFVGALLILIAYVGHQLGWINARGAAYNIMNATGSAILAWIVVPSFSGGLVVARNRLDGRQHLGAPAAAPA